MIVVADSGPLHYLVLLEHIELLPRFYGQVLVPEPVAGELSAAGAPALVRDWITKPPTWVDVRPVPPDAVSMITDDLDLGERAAIALAETMRADLLLIDEAAGRAEAKRRHLRVTGTLGVLRAGAEQGLVNVPELLERLNDQLLSGRDALERGLRPMAEAIARRRGTAGATVGRVAGNRIMVRRRSGPPRIRSTDMDLGRALEAMTAPELRAFIRAVLDEFEDEQRRRLIDSLMTRAAKGDAGWKPNRPSSRIVNDARSFADAAQQVGHADPDDVSEHLRLASKAFLAGDHASSRAVFEALLIPISTVDVDLGQHELVDDVLSVDVHTCIAQYVTSVYTTTALPDRAGAVFKAIENVKPIGSVLNPIAEMEGVSAGALPDLGAFLPRWVKHLGRRRPSKDEWESDHERWLREAVLHLEGVDGVERLARKTKRPQTCLAWCEALVDRGDWAGALHAYDDSVALVGKSHWRGELLDGAALAAQQLKRSDLAERLAAAWHAAPTLARLLRWLVTEDRNPTALRLKARKIVSRCPKTAGRQLGLLRLLACDVSAAADLLSQAPGLGWSNDEHPGHVLFPSFALLLAHRTSRSVPDALLADLESTCRDPLEVLSHDDVERRPKLGTPSIATLIQGVSSTITVVEENLRSMVDAMCVAAERRVEGILGNSRRRQYGHAAMLVASCVALAPAGGGKDLSAWMMGLRRTYSRRHAFREELRRAMESQGVRD